MINFESMSVKPPKKPKETPIKLNMTFEQAMKKALNTSLPVKKSKKKDK
jgi:hypothetical protein